MVAIGIKRNKVFYYLRLLPQGFRVILQLQTNTPASVIINYSL